MKNLKMPTLILWLLFVLLGAVTLFLADANTQRRDTIKNLNKSNAEQLQEIAKKDSLLRIDSVKIFNLNVRLVQVDSAYTILTDKLKEVKPKYEKLYLNPATPDWIKLDSLATNLLHGESGLRE